LGRHGEGDAGAFDAGDDDADQPALGIHHRAAAVAGIQGAVDLHLDDLVLVIGADAGNRRLGDGDPRIAFADG